MKKLKTLLLSALLLTSLTSCTITISKSSNSSRTSSTSSTKVTSTTSKTTSSKSYSENGYTDIDFSKSKYPTVQSLSSYYACPTTGNVKFLVLPIEFSDKKASSLGYSISNLKRVFSSSTDEKMRYYSVGDYFNTSSYGKLNITFDVLDKWYSPSHNSTYYISGAGSQISYYGQKIDGGDQRVMDDILSQLEDEGYDLSQYDSNDDGYIDGVICINTLDVSYDPTIQWAYQYYNFLVDAKGARYEYDGVSAFNYFWGSYAFLNEHYEEEDGEYIISYKQSSEYDSSQTYTYIHELSHIFGVVDYYDTTYSVDTEDTALAGLDVMDATASDHNPFTKFQYGWVSKSRLVNAETSVTLELTPFIETGDTIIIASSFSESKGAYQEYYIVSYYKNTSLNIVEGESALFSRDGIVVYHVDGTLSGTLGEYTFKYSNDYNTKKKYLVEYVKCTSNSESTFTYVEGDKLSSTLKDHNSNTIPYTFEIDSLTSEKATITFTKNA